MDKDKSFSTDLIIALLAVAMLASTSMAIFNRSFLKNGNDNETHKAKTIMSLVVRQ